MDFFDWIFKKDVMTIQNMIRLTGAWCPKMMYCCFFTVTNSLKAKLAIYHKSA